MTTIFRRLRGETRRTAYFILALTFPGCFACSDGFAIESICPGGSSPRGDISFCTDFSSLSHCTTGQEALCQSDNGITLSVPSIKGFKVKTCPISSPVTSSTGCAYGSGAAGGSGPGYMHIASDQTGSTSACMRYYVRFADTYLQNVSNNGNHGPALQYSDGTTACGGNPCCGGDILIDFTMSKPRLQIEPSATTCGESQPTSYNPASTNTNYTGTNWTPKNGQWYRVDMCATMNTTSSSASAGNGTVTVKIDGVTLVSTTTANMRGPSTTTKFRNAYLARGSMGLGVPNWEPNEYFAAFAWSNNGTEIGASAEQTSLGTGETLSPYGYNVASDGGEFNKLANDCSSPNSITHYIGYENAWGNPPTEVSTPQYNGYPCNAECSASGCAGTHSVQWETTGTGQSSGVDRLPSNLDTTYFHQIVNHHRIYLPTLNSVGGNNDYTNDTVLSGFARYGGGGGGGGDHDWIGLSIMSGNIGIALGTDNVAGAPLTTNTALVKNTWHDYQLAVGSDNKCYLQWDGTWIINGTDCGTGISTWVFDDVSGGPQHIIQGILKNPPATRFTIYTDDLDVGAVSFNDTKFWGAVSPFSASSSGSTSTTRIGYFLLRRHRL